MFRYRYNYVQGGGVRVARFLSAFLLILVGVSTNAIARPWTPADMTNAPAAWYDASDTSTITESAGAVSQWDDKSGNGNHAVQGTGSSQPSTGVTNINSLNALRFDGSNDYLYNTTLNISKPYTVYAVVKTDAGSPSRQYIFDGRTPGARSVIALRESGQVQMWAGLWKSSGIATPASACVVAGYFVNTGYNSELAVNGTNVVIGNIGSSTLTSGLNIGINHYANDDRFKGEIGELVIVSSTLTVTSPIDPAARQKMEGYLAWKWGLEASLPAGHPYETIPPPGPPPDGMVIIIK